MDHSFTFSDGTLHILELEACRNEYDLDEEWNPPQFGADLPMNIADFVNV